MQQLHLVGFTADLNSLIFSSRKGAKSGGFMLPLNEELVALVAEALRRRQEAGAGVEVPPEVASAAPGLRRQSLLSPREIQARLRAGRSTVQVAAEAGVDEEWVARFAAPVAAERSQVVSQARQLRYAKPRRGPSAETLGTSVRWNLAERGVRLTNDEFDAGWSGYQVANHTWMVTFSFVSRKRSQLAQWEVELGEAEIYARNRLASDLGYVEPGRRRRSLESLLPEQPGAASKLAERAGATPARPRLSDLRPAGGLPDEAGPATAEPSAPSSNGAVDAATPPPEPAGAKAASRGSATKTTATRPTSSGVAAAKTAKAATRAGKAGKALPGEKAPRGLKAGKAGKADKVSKATKATKAASKATKATKATKAGKATRADKVSKATKAGKVSKATKAGKAGKVSKATEAGKAGKAGKADKVSKATKATKATKAVKATKATKATKVGKASGREAAGRTVGGVKGAGAGGAGGRRAAAGHTLKRGPAKSTPLPTAKSQPTGRARGASAPARAAARTAGRAPTRGATTPAVKGAGRSTAGRGGTAPADEPPAAPAPSPRTELDKRKLEILRGEPGRGRTKLGSGRPQQSSRPGGAGAPEVPPAAREAGRAGPAAPKREADRPRTQGATGLRDGGPAAPAPDDTAGPPSPATAPPEAEARSRPKADRPAQVWAMPSSTPMPEPEPKETSAPARDASPDDEGDDSRLDVGGPVREAPATAGQARNADNGADQPAPAEEPADRVLTIRAKRATPPTGDGEPEAELVLPADRPPLRPAQPAAQPRRRRFGRTSR